MSDQNERRALFLFGILLAVLLFVGCRPSTIEPGSASSPAGENAGGITVVGRGEAFGQPDLAEIHLGVEIFGETVAAATADNQASVEAIMTALEEMGIASEDVQTSNYSVWAEQRYGENGPEGISGYRVSNQVRVTIRDIDRVGAVISAVTEAGANTIHGIAFRVADPAGLEAEARAEAIANARERAQSLADLAGVELGNVVEISEIIGQAVPFAGRGVGGGMAMDEAAAPGINPGQLSYGVEVQVTFALSR